MITLLTDFGYQDVYVGVMKGVIAQINPTLPVIDLSHAIPPQNIAAARFNLMNAWAYFPEGTVHLAVVDPGVGSTRRAVAIAFAQGFLVGPDNGLFSGVLAQQPALQAVTLTNSAYWLTPCPSVTFHGRDIFAPVAAHLASGVPLPALGEEINPADLVQFSGPSSVQIAPHHWSASIQYIDGFGNLVTNLPSHSIASRQGTVVLAGSSIPIGHTYQDVLPGAAIALVGSHGWLEIAQCQGSAQHTFNAQVGDTLEIILNDA